MSRVEKILFKEINLIYHNFKIMNNFKYIKRYSEFCNNVNIITNFAQLIELIKISQILITEGKENNFLVLNEYKQVEKIKSELEIYFNILKELNKEQNLLTINKQLFEKMIVNIYGEHWTNFLKFDLNNLTEFITLMFNEKFDDYNLEIFVDKETNFVILIKQAISKSFNDNLEIKNFLNDLEKILNPLITLITINDEQILINGGK